jgi:WD40 repeat protein
VLGHVSYPTAIAYAPDGRSMACTHGGGVTIWRLADGRAHQPATGDLFRIVAFSPDGLLLATCNLNLTLLFEARAGRFARLTWDQDGPARPCSLAFSPDGRTLAVGRWVPQLGLSGDHFIRLADPRTGAKQATLRGHGNAATSLAFSPDGRTLAAACGQFLWAWDLSSGRPVAREKAGSHYFQAVAFTPDGHSLVAARNDGTVRLYDARTWRERSALDWKIGPLVSLAVAPDGMRAAAGSKRGKVVVWDLDV